MRIRTIKKASTIALILLFVLCASSAFAAGDKAIALVMSVKGNVEINKNDAWAAAKFGTVLDDGDQIRTGEGAFASLVFTDDKSQLKIRPNTVLELRGERADDYSITKRVNMEIGELFADVKQQKGTLQVATPTSVASVKGTEFWVLILQDGETQLLTLEGLVELLNLSSGQAADVAEGSSAVTTPAGEIEIEDINESDIPGFIEETLETRNIEIKFTDEDGNEKRLIINFKETEE